MTRRGSVIYYLAAWILGCFFMSLLVWMKDTASSAERMFHILSAFGLMFFYFYGLILGAFTAFLNAFLLRQAMLALKCKTAWHWAVAGAFLSPALVALLGVLGRRMSDPQLSHKTFTAILTWGPELVLEAGWWLAIPAGAATAYLLCRIERAFAPQPVSA